MGGGGTLNFDVVGCIAQQISDFAAPERNYYLVRSEKWSPEPDQGKEKRLKSRLN